MLGILPSITTLRDLSWAICIAYVSYYNAVMLSLVSQFLGLSSAATSV